jgi:hypothetical protein
MHSPSTPAAITSSSIAASNTPSLSTLKGYEIIDLTVEDQVKSISHDVAEEDDPQREESLSSGPSSQTRPVAAHHQFNIMLTFYSAR